MAEALVVLSYVAAFGGVVAYAAWLYIRRRKLQN